MVDRKAEAEDSNLQIGVAELRRSGHASAGINQFWKEAWPQNRKPRPSAVKVTQPSTSTHTVTGRRNEIARQGRQQPRANEKRRGPSGRSLGTTPTMVRDKAQDESGDWRRRVGATMKEKRLVLRQDTSSRWSDSCGRTTLQAESRGRTVVRERGQRSMPEASLLLQITGRASMRTLKASESYFRTPIVDLSLQ
ncbi:unnamed protein product [Caenorhabditis auriculariae]|uniref:Uncharacterized protein n=1 Tax=Caenorhabditis auriculariae TaxID=2777116 RepID=A0A8S1HHC7_9PELO|nr:unnamed protein product [Caenorhabditis auriculariae]